MPCLILFPCLEKKKLPFSPQFILLLVTHRTNEVVGCILQKLRHKKERELTFKTFALDVAGPPGYHVIPPTLECF